MSQTTENAQPGSVEALLAYNTTLLERHKRLRCFRMFSDGTFEDPVKRETFFACLQALARHFQTMLFMRQGHCADDDYSPLFLRHLREEIGHDEVLRQDRGRSDELWDPVIEGVGAWFVSRMAMLDNIEKTAIIHLVLESSGAYMGSVSREAMRRFGSAKYFGLHDEADQTHMTLGLSQLQHQSPETIARLRVVIEQAWQMVDTWADRVASLVLGTARAAQ